MRIGFVSPYPDKERLQLTKMSAVAQYTDNLVKNTFTERGQGYELTVFTEILDRKERYEEELKTGDRMEVVRCYKPGKTPFTNVFRSIGSRSFDIIHIQHETFLYGGILSFFALPFFVAAVRLRAQAVVTLHHIVPKNQINPSFSEIYQTNTPLSCIRNGFSTFYKLIGWAATELVVHEEYFKEVLVGDYGVKPEKIRVIAHGVLDPTLNVTSSRQELMKEFLIPDDAATIFGFFGYISKYKGLDYLISEFTEYLKSAPSSVLLIAGAMHPRMAADPEYVRYVEGLKTAAQAAGGRIIWYGPIDSTQVTHFYKLVDCIVLPYKQTTSASSVLSCAIGSETAFLVSDSLKPTVRNGALTFGLYKNALAKKLLAFTNRNLHTESSAQIFVEDLKKKRVWPVVGGKTLGLYRQMIDGAAPKGILLAGAYGQSNLGDEYMLDVCLRLFGKENTIVLSSDPYHTVHVHGVTAVSSRTITWRGVRAFLECSAIVVGGGDQFKLIKKSAGRNRYSLLAEMAALALCARIWRKKLCYLGVGIGNISGLPARLLTRFCLAQADTVTLRDAGSYKMATELAKRDDIVEASDLTFLDCDPPRSARETRERTLAIAPAYEVEHPDRYARMMLQIGTAAQRRLEANPDLRVQFFPFQPGFHEHTDIRVSHDIMQHVQATERCSVDTKFSKDSIGQAYRNTDVLWGIRLHSLVFACMHSVPFIALIYDEKIRRFLKEIGCEQWGIELDETFSADKLLETHERLLREMPLVVAHLNEQKAVMMRKSEIHRAIARDIKASLEPGTPSHAVRIRPLPN